MMEDNQIPEIQEDLGTGGKFKNWLQDNIRIIISVLIVIAIAGGIYSYSKRGEVLTTTEDEIAMQEADNNEAVTVVGGDNANQAEESSGQAAQNPTEIQPTEKTTPAVTPTPTEQTTNENVQVDQGIQENSATSVSEETDAAFVETAVRGDSKTTLARKALRDYLEKNQDSSLTAEHKIYIEDYLRRQVQHSGTLQVGDSINFSKVMIKDAIEKSKTLNESQLNNLKKYSARVSNL